MSKKKYLCVQRGVPGSCESPSTPSPAEMEAMYSKFNAWKEKFNDNLLDLGGPLASDGCVVRADGAIDGPFIEAKEIIGGYMIITAANMDEAMAVVKESPGIGMPGSSVEVREITMP